MGWAELHIAVNAEGTFAPPPPVLFHRLKMIFGVLPRNLELSGRINREECGANMLLKKEGMRMKAWKYLEGLCQWPHRGSATEGERRAGDWIEEQMRAMGFQVERQEFSSPRDCLYLLPLQSLIPLLLLGVIGLVGDGGGGWVDILLAGLGMAAIVPLLLEVLGSEREINIFPQHPSSNVMAYQEKGFEEKHTIIVSGHYDTQKGSYLFAPWFVDHTQTFFYSVYGAIGLFLLALLLRPLISWMHYLLLPAVIWTGVSAAFLLVCQVKGRYTQGANDNGTGTALTMAIAEDYIAHRDQYPQGVQFLFLFTGCEEVGSRGMKHFLRTYAGELLPEKTDFLVLDNIGSGKVTYLLGEGMLKVIPYDPQLLGLAQRLQNEYPAGTVLTQPNLLLPTDSLPVISKGYRSISFLGKDASGRLGNYHWHTDLLENVDREVVLFAEEFFLRYVRELAELRGKAEKGGE